MIFVRKFVILSALAVLSNAAFAQKDTVVTPNGHRFINHTRLPGPHAQPGDFVFFHVATIIGDSLMGSTASFGGPREWQLPLPAELPKRVPSLYDAILLMTKGDSATLIQTMDDLMRKNVPAALQAEKDVRFEILLVDVVSAADKAHRDSVNKAEVEARRASVESQTKSLAQDFGQGKLKGKTEKTASGLQYIVHDPGAGAPLKKGENVKVHFYGCLTSGKHFDDSFSHGEPLPFTLGMGQMIPGFEEGTALLRHGGKATLFVPYQLGFGEEGTADGVIPGKSDLVFYIDIQ